MTKPATIAARMVSCRLVPAGYTALGASAGVTLGTSSRSGLSISACLPQLATLVDAYRGRGLPPLPVTLAGIPLFPSEMELPADGDRPRERLWHIAVNYLEATNCLLD